MISVVILTYRPAFLEPLLKNIEETIGVTYETIIIDNGKNSYSICSAYNEGSSRCRYDYICFLHEDVLIQTQNWGQLAVSKMEADKKCGLIGVMGASFKSAFPTGWYNPANNCRYLAGNILQGKKSLDTAKMQDFNPGGSNHTGAVCIDGVFMFTRREVMEKCRFDEEMLQGFHGYDMDFSLQVISKGYDITIIKDLIMVHFSEGSPDEKWDAANRMISQKWKKQLPAAAESSGIRNIFSLAFNEFETVHIHDNSARAVKLMKAPFRIMTIILNCTLNKFR